MSYKFETRNVKKKQKKKTMVKQNKQINDQNSYWLKAQRKKGKQRTSKQAKKKKRVYQTWKKKVLRAQVNSKQNISKEF